MTTVLIITRSDDNESVELVAKAVERKGGRCIRFDTDRYPTEVRLSAFYGRGDEERLTLTNEEGEFDLREVTAIWHRRLNFGGHLPKTLDKQLRTLDAADPIIAGLDKYQQSAFDLLRSPKLRDAVDPK